MSLSAFSTASCILTTKRLLEGIKQDMVKWQNYGLLKHFLNTSNMSDAIRQCNVEIDNFLEAFQVSDNLCKLVLVI